VTPGPRRPVQRDDQPPGAVRDPRRALVSGREQHPARERVPAVVCRHDPRLAKAVRPGDFPFFWVNLASYAAPEDATGQTYAFLREAQTQTLDLPNTGQAITIDIGDPKDIHPTNKQEVGRRLALLAKNRVYGVPVEDSGPTFANINRGSGVVIVTFGHASGGIIPHDRPPQSVEIAGPDQVFHPALVRLARTAMFVTSPDVKDPVAVRYAWKNAPDANLFNGAGLPVVPFRTDNW
jgi:sialate O-acetylesterase